MMENPKLIGAICAVVFLFVIILIIILLVRSSYTVRNRAEIAQKHCEEYRKLACKFAPSNKESSPLKGGTDVSDGIFPHMASVQVEGIHHCGGTLISEYFVMTFATIVLQIKKNWLNVKLGASDYRQGTSFGVDEKYVHPSFNLDKPETVIYNIALLKLVKKVEFNWKIRPICLNTNFESISTVNTIAAGWGPDETGTWSTTLQKIDLQVGQMRPVCVQKAGLGITEFMVCAGNPTKPKSVCSGDYGGPLQIALDNGCPNVYEQIGIIFAPFPNGTCKSAENPLSLSLRVEFLLPWIVDVVWPD